MLSLVSPAFRDGAAFKDGAMDVEKFTRRLRSPDAYPGPGLPKRNVDIL
jgi:hypothetical protein